MIFGGISVIGAFNASDDHDVIMVFAPTKILVDFALQCAGYSPRAVQFLGWVTDRGPTGHHMTKGWIGLYVQETENTGYHVSYCPVGQPQPKTIPSSQPRHQARPRIYAEVSTVTDPDTLKRRRAIDAPPELPLPVHEAPAATGDVHLLKDDIDRRAVGVLAWAPWARRRRHASRRYEGFARTGTGGW